MESVGIAWSACEHFAGLEPPSYASQGASGLDLRAACGEQAPLVLESGERGLVPTGIRVMIPAGYEGQVRSRSGLALRRGLVCLNAPGTIDSDYRGELQVLLVNLGDGPVRIFRGDRIAQLVIVPVLRVRLERVDRLPDSDRGDAGFGSTGIG